MIHNILQQYSAEEECIKPWLMKERSKVLPTACHESTCGK